jgi:nucleotide-binding universal stress UspA family protein
MQRRTRLADRQPEEAAMNVTRRLVVGVDGSSGADRALRWAISEAHSRGGTVQAVWVCQPTAASVGEADLLATGQTRLDAAVTSALTVASAVAVASEVMIADPAAALVELSRDADLLVLGSHGHSRTYHALLGSVAETCARTASCPVVVIPVREQEPVPAPAASLAVLRAATAQD